MTPTQCCATLGQCGTGKTSETERLLRWAADSLGGNAIIESVQALHDDQGPWLLRVAVRRRTEHFVLRSLTPRIDAEMIATGAAALEVADSNSLPAPRLIAKDLAGTASGAPATLETFVVCSTVWPRAISVSRLHTAGAALAQVHAVPLTPRPDLPLRLRPIAVDDFAKDRRQGDMATTPLLQTADEWIRSILQPQGHTVFLHGDVWPGNLAWIDNTHCILIDWKSAGAGNPGVDLGELRKQVAIAYGLDQIDAVTEGWQQATGRPATDIAYWDAVAALNTRTDLGPATPMRDAFLR
ncbi:MAG: hypothetical protein QOD39_4333, partial [Mycobacterium sp.]|nr:hypothetical protein [Mycobacterium sp.]